MSAFKCYNTLIQELDDGITMDEVMGHLKDSYDDHEIELALARYNRNNQEKP